MNTTTRWIIELAHEAAEYVAARDAAEEFSDAWAVADIRVARLCTDANDAGEGIAFARILNNLTATAVREGN